MVTPSLVMVGAPNFFSRTTLRPRGPRVTLTALASLLTPTSSSRRASSPNLTSFVAIVLPRGVGGGLRDGSPPDQTVGALLLLAAGAGDLGQDVAPVEDEQVLAVDLDLGAAVLRVDDDVSHGDVEGNDLAGVLGPPARPHRQHLSLLRLLLGRVRDDQTRNGGLLRLVGPHKDAILEGLQGHDCLPWLSWR